MSRGFVASSLTRALTSASALDAAWDSYWLRSTRRPSDPSLSAQASHHMPDDNGNILSGIEPGSFARIHLVGVAGTGMGSFAGMLKTAGYEVTGSDESVYPPMSDMLAAWGVEVMTPYSPANLDAARPDLVIIGNVIRRVNVEATAVRERGIPQMSFPAAFGSLVLVGKHSVVVEGTK